MVKLDFSNVDIYRCSPDICSDNGGGCIHIIPKDFNPPNACTNPDDFHDELEDGNPCKWEKISSEEFIDDFLDLEDYIQEIGDK